MSPRLRFTINEFYAKTESFQTWLLRETFNKDERLNFTQTSLIGSSSKAWYNTFNKDECLNFNLTSFIGSSSKVQHLPKIFLPECPMIIRVNFVRSPYLEVYGVTLLWTTKQRPLSLDKKLQKSQKQALQIKTIPWLSSSATRLDDF